jgi:exodeoxyribonuclease VII large subunit
VTSKDAAALQDVLTVLERRWPAAEVVLAPAPVQGPEAAPLLVEALRAVARTPAELVILARGGGSIEELWAFHNEGLARAIRACPVPVVTGVGHETDVTIADLAADVRAPTPSAAAELATPNRAELRESVDRVVGRGRSALSRRLDVAAQAHRTTAARLALAAPTRRLAERAEGVARLRRALDQGMSGRLRLVQADVSGLSARVRSLGPEPTLQRGYAVVLRARDGRAVTRSRDVRPGEALRVRLAEGAIAATVDRIEERDT